MADHKVTDDGPSGAEPMQAFRELLREQSQAAMALWGQFVPGQGTMADADGDAAQWAHTAQRLQAMWFEFQTDRAQVMARTPAYLCDPARWQGLVESWYRRAPLADPQRQKALWTEGLALCQSVLGAATDLSQQADRLTSEVSKFLTSIRAA